MIKFIETTPWWFIIILYITTIVLGGFIGAPLMASLYNLPTLSEVQQLFVLTALIKFHYLFPILVVATCGLKFVRNKNNKTLTKVFMLGSIILTPSIFYATQAAAIYNYTGA
ncbi:hypothetical protein A7985_06220 [Pseudoalteromonas luteoviolacea]|uniref:Uncharacterized protein n=1 Tax=Pseudoalteromonas luteoviolacea TaxID=43657 RepID=A0A1C0TW45_9GAMM|nr:hypothetical protein A7985_06220 [Pseudoalteromonas luteoviolacea]